jgi:hypothetical protein
MESHKMRHACILYVLCGSHNKHYFPYNIKWLMFVMETTCLLCHTFMSEK